MSCTRCQLPMSAPHQCASPVLGSQPGAGSAAISRSWAPPAPSGAPSASGVGHGWADPDRYGPPPGQLQRPVPPGTPYGPLAGVIPRAIGWRGRFDVLVYERALLVAKVPGVDPAVVGFLVGFVVSGWLGYVIGDRIGAAGNAERVAALAWSDPEEIVRRHRRNCILPVNQVRSGRIDSYGASGGRLHLDSSATGRIKLKWTRPHTRNLDVAALLQRVVGPVVPVTRRSAIRPYLGPGIAVALVVLLLVLPAVVGAMARQDLREAQAHVAPVCTELIDLDRRIGTEGYVPPDAEWVAVFDRMRRPFQEAARRSTEFAPASAAVGRLRLYYSTPVELIGPGAATTAEADHDTLWASCQGI